MRCDAMLCGWFALGLIKEELVKEELVEEGKEEMANHHERERQSIVKGKAFEYRVYYVFWLVFFFFFLNIVMTWKIMGVSKVSVIYIYIYIYIDKRGNRSQHCYNIFTINYRWLVVIGSNLNITLRLHFCPNNNNQ